MPAVMRPATRCLHCKDPGIVSNYVKLYKSQARKQRLLKRIQKLEDYITYPPTAEMQKEYESIDALNCEITRFAEKRCRKLRKGQVAFSLELQQASRAIAGGRVSSRLLARTLRKVKLPADCRLYSSKQLKIGLQRSYQEYYAIKKVHIEERGTYLDNLAEALAQQNDGQKQKILVQLCQRETQRLVARKIRYLRGKMTSGSTTFVTVENANGSVSEFTKRGEIEAAILKKQS
jgi:hypothetical protein